MANKVKVTVMDQAGGKTVTAELPTNAAMKDLLPALVTKMKLPLNVQYGVMLKRSGKQLGSSDTLTKAGVREDDILRLLPDVHGA